MYTILQHSQWGRLQIEGKRMPQPTCPKCHGFLILHAMDDQSIVVRAARCINCGNIVDPVINAAVAVKSRNQRQVIR